MCEPKFSANSSVESVVLRREMTGVLQENKGKNGQASGFQESIFNLFEKAQVVCRKVRRNVTTSVWT